ncbi:MAG: serine/threonine-protein kinase [Phycisphaerae bacterium]|nr:serine/threonine-protein kinase [Phycisphaerae bacterium]
MAAPRAVEGCRGWRDVNDPRWSVVRAALERLLETPSAARPALLDELCGNDEALRRELESLLKNSNDDGFLASPALGRPLGDAVSVEEIECSESGLQRSQVGPFRLVRVLGRGGMGVVYEAEQEEPRRSVALKLFRPAPGEDESLQRFRREAATLARLQHPNIVAVLQAGREPDGLHWLAMELVRGRTLDRWLAEQSPPLATRVAVMALVCDAVHAAHVRGIVHRDLKPGNIMLDAENRPYVLDFGLARVSEPGLASMVTAPGRVLGTLAYMSPEQACAHSDDVDARSDIYSLGLIIYEALSGARAVALHDIALPEAVRIIRDETPRSPAGVNRALRGDFETVIRAAIEKNPARRYASAAALASDLRAAASGEPIRARSPTTGYLLRTLCWRHRRMLAGAAAIALTLASGGAAVSLLSRATRAEAATVRAEAILTDQVYLGQISRAMLLLQAPLPSAAAEVLEACDPALRGWEWHWLKAQVAPPLVEINLGDGRVLAVRAMGGELSIIAASSGGVRALRYSANDGRVIAPPLELSSVTTASCAAVGPNGDVALALEGKVILDARPGTGERGAGECVVETGFDGVGRMKFSSDGQLLAVSEAVRDPARIFHASMLVIDVPRCTVVRRFQHVGYATDIEWANRSQRFAASLMQSAGNDEGPSVLEWTRATAATTRHRALSQPRAIAWSADDQMLAVAFNDNCVRWWTLTDGAPGHSSMPVFGRHEHAVSEIAIIEGRLVTASAGGEICGWRSNGSRATFFGLPGETGGAAWTAVGGIDGRRRGEGPRVWCHRGGRRVTVWPLGKVDAGGAVDSALSQTGIVGAGKAIDVSPDGGSFARVTDDQCLVRGVGAAGEVWVVPVAKILDVACLRQDRIAVRTRDALGLWGRDASGTGLSVWTEDIATVAMARSSDGTRCVTIAFDGGVQWWSVGDRELVREGDEESAPGARHIAVSRSHVAVASADGRVWLAPLDGTGRAPLRPVAPCQLGAGDQVTALALDDDGGVALGFRSGDVAFRRAEDGWHRRPAHVGNVHSLARGPGANRVLSAGVDGFIRLWRTADGEPLLTLPGFGSIIFDLAVTPDGTTIIESGATGVRAIGVRRQ